MQKRNVLRHVGVVIILSVCVSVALNIFLLLINLPQYSERYQEVSEILYTPPFWQQLLTSGLLIPIVEEVMFRGIIFRLLRRCLAFPWAMLVSAMVFGAYHGNLVQFIYAGMCGMLLAYLCEKYDSIVAPILSHMAMNTAAIILTQIGVFAWMVQSGLMGAIIMIVLGAFAIVLICKLQKKDVTKVLKIYCKHGGNDI